MSATSRLLSLFGASIFRHTTILSAPPSSTSPIRFTKPFPLPKTLRFHRYSSSYSTAVLDTVESPKPEASSSDSSPHPWPEWVNFVNHLKCKGYFIPETPSSSSSPLSPLPVAVRDEEDGAGGGGGESEKSDVISYNDMNFVKDACLSFARDRYDILKSLSKHDIQTLVEVGCPNLFRKAVNSGKRLRAYLQLDEGDVCSACNLRGSCDRAYVILKESEAAARTVDIVRILLFYALDSLVILGGEKPPGRELVEASARNLLSDLIVLSEIAPDPALSIPASKATPRKKQSPDHMDEGSFQDGEIRGGDWTCPKCNFMNFARNTRCLKCSEDGPKRVGSVGGVGPDVEMKKGDWVCPECSFMNFSRNIRCLKCKTEGPKRVAVDDVEMKKGDWNCPQCAFMNFASNTKCLRCREARPKRQLNPGEWECPKCDFLNYRKNMVCLKCDCKRPKTQVAEHEEHLWRRPS